MLNSSFVVPSKEGLLGGEFNSWEAESLPMKKYTEGLGGMLKLLPAVMSIKWLWTMLDGGITLHRDDGAVPLN